MDLHTHLFWHLGLIREKERGFWNSCSQMACASLIFLKCFSMFLVWRDFFLHVFADLSIPLFLQIICLNFLLLEFFSFPPEICVKTNKLKKKTLPTKNSHYLKSYFFMIESKQPKNPHTFLALSNNLCILWISEMQRKAVNGSWSSPTVLSPHSGECSWENWVDIQVEEWNTEFVYLATCLQGWTQPLQPFLMRIPFQVGVSSELLVCLFSFEGIGWKPLLLNCLCLWNVSEKQVHLCVRN